MVVVVVVVTAARALRINQETMLSILRTDRSDPMGAVI